MVPPDTKGRTWRGNQAYRSFLVDGFLAGLWKLDDDVLTLEPFGRLTRGQREELVEEAGRTLTVLHGEGPYDIRFGTVAVTHHGPCGRIGRGRCEPLVAGSQRPLVSPEDVPQEPVGRPIPASPGTRSRGQELTCAATALEKVVSRV